MKFKVLLVFYLIFFIVSCSGDQELAPSEINWEDRKIRSAIVNQKEKGETYLSIYSEIYSQSQHQTHSLTVTVSIRNMNKKDTIVLDRADYFNSNGKLIKTYFDFPLQLLPMETIEIIIDKDDTSGGSGANFIFNWRKASTALDPLFESIMISTTSQQGLSFSTRGIRVK